MTLRQFIAEISNTKESLMDKEIVIEAKNGLLFEPRIKFIPKDQYDLQLDAEHIDKIIVCID